MGDLNASAEAPQRPPSRNRTYNAISHTGCWWWHLGLVLGVLQIGVAARAQTQPQTQLPSQPQSSPQIEQQTRPQKQLPQQPPQQPPSQPLADIEKIVVTAHRDPLIGVLPERTVGAQDIAGYGVDTVEDLINQVMTETGDDDTPVFLVNGERVTGLNDISSLPPEALSQLDILPRGAGTRFGLPADTRVYNIVLKKNFKAETFEISRRSSTEGDWNSTLGDAIFTRIKNDNRINITFRARDEDSVTESDRDITQLTPALPYDLRGNIISNPFTPGGQIDPRLSALAGSPVSVVVVPAGAHPTLADFAAGANDVNTTNLGDYRTLRPDARVYDLNMAGGARLARWLTSTFSVRLTYTENNALDGLASGVLALPPSNPNSPFSQNVGIAAYGDPLRQRTRQLSENANFGLNAIFGDWRWNFGVIQQDAISRTATDRQNPSQQTILLDNSIDPFAGNLANLLPTLTDHATGDTSSTTVQTTLTGTPIKIPSGLIQTTLDGHVIPASSSSQNTILGVPTSFDYSRTEAAVRGALEVPLASRRNHFLSALGELSINGDYQYIGYSNAAPGKRYGYGASWTPRDWIRLNALTYAVTQPAAVSMLDSPTTATPGVRLLDILTGQTVDVTEITGGNPNLLPQTAKTSRLTTNIRPIATIDWRLNVEYTVRDYRNLIANLPPTSVPIWLAFPDRFTRDDDGELTEVDFRPVNFARQLTRTLRYGVTLNLPLSRSSAAMPMPIADESAEGGTPVPNAVPDDRIERSQDLQAGQAIPSPQSQGPPMSAAGRGGGGGGFAGGGRGGRGGGSGRRPGPPQQPRGWRLQFTASHAIVLSNQIDIRPGLPPVNLLSGGAIGVGTSTIQQQVNFSMNLTGNGMGFRVTGLYQGGSVLQLAGGDGGYLTFEPLMTLNATAFVEGTRLFPRAPWLMGTRVALLIVNITDSRQQIINSAGVTPLGYQPGNRDPLGRTIQLELRKQF